MCPIQFQSCLIFLDLPNISLIKCQKTGYQFLGCDAIQSCRNVMTFRRNVLPPSSGPKSKPRRQRVPPEFRYSSARLYGTLHYHAMRISDLIIRCPWLYNDILFVSKLFTFRWYDDKGLNTLQRTSDQCTIPASFWRNCGKQRIFSVRVSRPSFITQLYESLLSSNSVSRMCCLVLTQYVSFICNKSA
jgi:hypothetical protein